MPIRNRLSYFASLLNTPPRAIAIVRGSNAYPGIYGEVRFYQTVYGTLVAAGEIIGRTLVLHSMPDDFTSQSAGNSGAKIACGTIVAQ